MHFPLDCGVIVVVTDILRASRSMASMLRFMFGLGVVIISLFSDASGMAEFASFGFEDS